MRLAPLAICVLLLATALPGAPRAEAWAAGGYSFSDERGGFRLLSASGSGTYGDPIVLVEELLGTGPAVLTVRRLPPEPDERGFIPAPPILSLAVIKIVINRSRRVWGGFDLELQEALSRPSPYGDGLSFDQMRSFDELAHSDRFATSREINEPYDRVRFAQGSVDPGAAARFNFYITDPTPVPEFYIVQEPRLLMARARPTARPPAHPVQLAQRPVAPGDFR
jgi:hypothetical protein